MLTAEAPQSRPASRMLRRGARPGPAQATAPILQAFYHKKQAVQITVPAIHGTMSSIVTFYSYKGGVGRSMALANIAVLLARRGLKVLAVDWDLEAPGLERYFSYFDIKPADPACCDMFMEARDGRPASYRCSRPRSIATPASDHAARKRTRARRSLLPEPRSLRLGSFLQHPAGRQLRRGASANGGARTSTSS